MEATSLGKANLVVTSALIWIGYGVDNIDSLGVIHGRYESV